MAGVRRIFELHDEFNSEISLHVLRLDLIKSKRINMLFENNKDTLDNKLVRGTRRQIYRKNVTFKIIIKNKLSKLI